MRYQDVRKAQGKERHGARNGNRCGVMVRWLLEEFGIDRLRREGVVDVCGGAGELCARLAHCHGIPCVLMDERELSLDMVQETLRKRVAPKLPQKWRKKAMEERSERIDALVTAATGTFPRDFDGDATKGILVGMHADGATSAIVEVGLKYRRSFAVVPCCVFRNLFSPTSSGRAYEEYCDHLGAMKNVKRTVLNFPGRNICLYKKHVEIGGSLLEAQRLNYPVLMRDYWRPSSSIVDLHFEERVKDFPVDLDTPPDCEDWLGAFEKFDFLYYGPANSVTDWHKDVLATFSWSVNVRGEKLWEFENGHLAEQYPNDLIFVPSNLEHRVLNVSDCLSVNRNWFNQYNVDKVVEFLHEERVQVLKVLDRSDFRSENEYLWTIERLLKINSRFNFSDLVALLASKNHRPVSFDCPPIFVDPTTNRFPTEDHPDSWGKDAIQHAKSLLAAKCVSHVA